MEKTQEICGIDETIEAIRSYLKISKFGFDEQFINEICEAIKGNLINRELTVEIKQELSKAVHDFLSERISDSEVDSDDYYHVMIMEFIDKHKLRISGVDLDEKISWRLVVTVE